jgi:hypothetical protein
MARLRKDRTSGVPFDAITVEGALISPAMLARVAQHQAGAQTEADYGIPKGLTLRDEIARYFRIGQAMFRELTVTETPSTFATVNFVEKLLRDVFGLADICRLGTRTVGERQFAITLEGLGGRVPVVVVPPTDDLDRPSTHLTSDGRRRSASSALQEWLNASEGALWGFCANGLSLRLVRDNASLTRPAYIEADLRRIFEADAFADFAALWLLVHASRFGTVGSLPADCALERWRDAGQKEGVTARDKLRGGFEAALLSLGNGFLSHSHNTALRDKLQTGALPLPEFFGQLLRLVYRLIFLLVAEDRNLLHPPDAAPGPRRLYGDGYSVGALRDRAVRRSAWDQHHDRWEGLLVTSVALARGEKRLGLPALGGLFAPNVITNLESSRLANRNLMEAIFRLAWLRELSGLVPVNWRDMETEELGSVYESLLELTPQLTKDGYGFVFAEGGEAMGHARKISGSYYTPDSLVQALLDSALDPVLDRIEAEADDPAAALLSVTVLDPACGSGHFLLAAARRIATRVARLRTGGVASSPDYRHALRDVVRACVFGVDRNLMAVELCKVALWIEGLEPGKPLTFLDSHIRCGDSLIGVFNIDVLGSGIPDDAFKQLPGDKKDAASHYRAKNSREVKERKKVESGLGLAAGQTELSKAFAGLQERPEDSLEDIEAKRRIFDGLIAQDGPTWKLKTACDLWTAAWFAPKTEVPIRGRELVPTSGQVWEYLRGIPLYGPLIAEADRCAHTHRFFHWPIEFPDIMLRGGFDVVIGNPPWERVEVQEREFFAASYPPIANAQNAAKRKRLIEELAASDPRTFESWRAALRSAAVEVAFFKTSRRFPFGSPGKINTYAIFADLFRQAISNKGFTGLVLPTGLVGGYTYRDFLGHLLKTKTLVSFYGFENEDLIFPHITNKVRFGILTLSGVKLPVEQPWFTAHIRQPTEITDPERRYTLGIEEIEAINPNTLNLPAFRWAKDAEVAAAIHRAAPILVRKCEDGSVDSPWGVEFRTLFNMATDSGLFQDHQDVASLIIERRDALAVLNDGRQVYPLYEGKMYWHFDHRYGTYEGQTEQQANKGVLPRVSDAQHDDPRFRVEPRYWVDAALTHQALGEYESVSWFFSWRDVGPSERTFVGTLVPRAAIGHAAPILIAAASAKQKAALAALLSSLVVDYAARQKTNRMTFFIIEQLPLLRPSDLAQQKSWLGASPEDWLGDRVLELSYTNDELAPFSADLGRDHPPFRWQPARRVLLQAEIDAAVLHLYGLNRAHTEWLLDSFTVLRKYEEIDHREFLTKRIVLEIYDELAEAQRTGRAYQTRLDPIPADPSCCHAPNGKAAESLAANTGRGLMPRDGLA